MTQINCKWFAVVLPLEHSELDCFPGGANLGNTVEGKTVSISGYIDGKPVNVENRYGAALETKAQQKASEHTGAYVLPVEGEYMFNASDITELKQSEI